MADKNVFYEKEKGFVVEPVPVELRTVDGCSGSSLLTLIDYASIASGDNSTVVRGDVVPRLCEWFGHILMAGSRLRQLAGRI